MKITNLQTLCLSRLHEPERQWFTSRFRVVKADCAIVIIQTDEGLTGIGEACAYGVPSFIRNWVERLSPLLIGRNPLDPGLAPHPNGRKASYDCAVAGIDAALWDIRGKWEGKPVAKLLSGHALDRVTLYASGGVNYDWDNHPESLIDEVMGYTAQGYKACKVRIGSDWSWSGVTVDRFLGLMGDLAAQARGKIGLMVDGNQRLNEEQALIVAKELDRLGFIWLEEPIPQDQIDGYARLNRAVELPVTGGEQYTTVEQFVPYLEKQAYKIVQPDAGWCGLSEGMRIAEMADHYGAGLCPHNWHNGLMTVANAHFVAALPRPKYLELCMVQGPLQWGILANPPIIRDGVLEIPQAPGLGVDLAEGLAEKFPYIEGAYGIQVDRWV